MTGESSEYGLVYQNIVKLAVDEINEAGGINGKMLEVIYKDGKCDTEKLRNVMIELVQNVQFVIGGFCSSESFGAESVASENKILLFSQHH